MVIISELVPVHVQETFMQLVSIIRMGRQDVNAIRALQGRMGSVKVWTYLEPDRVSKMQTWMAGEIWDW